MHFFSRRNASLALSLAAVGVLAACGDDVTVPVAPPAPVVVSITPQAVTLNPGSTATLSVPEDVDMVFIAARQSGAGNAVAGQRDRQRNALGLGQLQQSDDFERRVRHARWKRRIHRQDILETGRTRYACDRGAKAVPIEAGSVRYLRQRSKQRQKSPNPIKVFRQFFDKRGVAHRVSR